MQQFEFVRWAGPGLGLDCESDTDAVLRKLIPNPGAVEHKTRILQRTYFNFLPDVRIFKIVENVYKLKVSIYVGYRT